MVYILPIIYRFNGLDVEKYHMDIELDKIFCITLTLILNLLLGYGVI